MEKQLTAVFMPTRNEQLSITKNIEVIKRAVERGKINHAVIVIDGSVDRTRKIIFSELGLNREQIKKLTSRKRGTIVLPNGFIILNHAKPQGKGRNFMEAMFTLKGRTSFFKNPRSVVVNIDADALDLEEKTIMGIAKDVRKKNAPMLLGQHHEFSPIGKDFVLASAQSTGFRAISARALRPLIEMDSVWVRTIPRKFGLDHALNILVFGKDLKKIKWSKKHGLCHMPPGRHSSEVTQIQQRKGAEDRMTGKKQFPIIQPDTVAFQEKIRNRQQALFNKVIGRFVTVKKQRRR